MAETSKLFSGITVGKSKAASISGGLFAPLHVLHVQQPELSVHLLTDFLVIKKKSIAESNVF